MKRLDDKEWDFLGLCPPEEYRACMVFEYSREAYRRKRPSNINSLWHCWWNEDARISWIMDAGLKPKRDKWVRGPWLGLHPVSKSMFMWAYGLRRGVYTDKDWAERVTGLAFDYCELKYVACPDLHGLPNNTHEFAGRMDHEGRSTFAAFVDWNYTDDKIVEDFRRWLLRERKIPERPPKKVHAPTKEKEKLKALAALRLMRHFKDDWSAASKDTRRAVKGTGEMLPLYSSDRGWEKAKIAALRYMKEMLAQWEI